MAFRIGQRVKVVGIRYAENAHLIGKAGTIVGTEDNGSLNDLWGWVVDIDGIGIRYRDSGHAKFIEPQFLAPISYSNQLSSWEAMKELKLWVPDEMRAGA